MVSWRTACGGGIAGGEAGFLFSVVGAVGIAGADADLMPGIGIGQGVFVARCTADVLAVTQPLVADLPHAVFIG